MARGWESKAVEAQIEAAETSAAAQSKFRLTPAQIDLLRQRESLLLSRTRILGELQTARKERYRRMLQETLEHLERELAMLADP